MDSAKALRLIGMALRARRLEVGFDAAAALTTSGRAKLAITASDASPRVTSRIRDAAEQSGTTCIAAPFDKFELGAALGRAECAAAATADSGFSKAIIEALNSGAGQYNTEVTSI